MPRSPEEFDRIREESRARILDSALTLFSQDGFAATSVRALAKHAGVSQGLLYNYFESKRELLRAIFERGLADVNETFAAAEAAAQHYVLEPEGYPLDAVASDMIRGLIPTGRAPEAEEDG